MNKNYRIITLLGTISGMVFFIPYYFNYLFIDFSILKMDNNYLLYTIACFLCYIPGGIIADRYSEEKLISYSLLLTGIGNLTLIYSKNEFILIFSFITLAMGGILLFWASSIKFILKLNTKYEVGRTLGLFECGKGIFGVIVMTLYYFMLHFNLYTLRTLLIFFSYFLIFYSYFIYIKLKDLIITLNIEVDKVEKIKRDQKIFELFKCKKIWIIGGVILINYILYVNTIYMNEFLYKLYDFEHRQIILFAFLRIYILKLVLGPISGLFLDKIGSALKFFIIVFLIYIFIEIMYMATPLDLEFRPFIIFNTVVITALSTIFNTIFFSLIPEFKLEASGRVIGIISAVGFLPGLVLVDLKRFLKLIPSYSSYECLFLINTLVAILGLFFSIKLYYKNNLKVIDYK